MCTKVANIIKDAADPTTAVHFCDFSVYALCLQHVQLRLQPFEWDHTMSITTQISGLLYNFTKLTV